MSIKRIAGLGATIASAALAATALSAGGASAATMNGDIVFWQDGPRGTGLFVRSAVDGSISKELGSGLERNPSWSPDGSSIAFDSLANGTRQVFRWYRDGRARVLTADPVGAADPDFSPDGDSIAYVRDFVNGSDITTMTAEGDDQHRLTDTGTNSAPSYSPDGAAITYLRFHDDRYSIRIVGADGASDQEVVGGVAELSEPSFTADGEHVLFSEMRDNQFDLKKVRLVDGQAEWITATPDANERQPVHAPDGSRILFTRNTLGEQNYRIYSSTIDGQDVRLISDARSVAVDADWLGVEVADPPQADPVDPPAAVDPNDPPAAPVPLDPPAGQLPPAEQAPEQPDNNNPAPAPGNNNPAPGNDPAPVPGNNQAPQRPDAGAGQMQGDSIAPRLVMKGKPKAGKRYPAAKVKRLKGKVRDNAAMGSVKLGMKRLGKPCRHLRTNGSLKAAKKCGFKMRTVLRGSASTKFSQKLQRLQSGRYKLKAVAVDAAGNKSQLRFGFRIK